eukprot:2127755-Rhodomonas_salina.6
MSPTKMPALTAATPPAPEGMPAPRPVMQLRAERTPERREKIGPRRDAIRDGTSDKSERKTKMLENQPSGSVPWM